MRQLGFDIEKHSQAAIEQQRRFEDLDIQYQALQHAKEANMISRFALKISAAFSIVAIIISLVSVALSLHR